MMLSQASYRTPLSVRVVRIAVSVFAFGSCLCFLLLRRPIGFLQSIETLMLISIPIRFENDTVCIDWKDEWSPPK